MAIVLQKKTPRYFTGCFENTILQKAYLARIAGTDTAGNTPPSKVGTR